MIGLSIILHYAVVVKCFLLCYKVGYGSWRFYSGFQWDLLMRTRLTGRWCQFWGQGRECPTAAKAAVCHRPAPLVALVLPVLSSPAQGFAPRPRAVPAANMGACPTAIIRDLDVIK